MAERVAARTLQRVAAFEFGPSTIRVIRAPHLVAPPDVHDSQPSGVGRRCAVGPWSRHPVDEGLRVRSLLGVLPVDHPVDRPALLVFGDAVLVARPADADDRLPVGVEQQLPQHHGAGARHRIAGRHALVVDGRVQHRRIRTLRGRTVLIRLAADVGVTATITTVRAASRGRMRRTNTRGTLPKPRRGVAHVGVY